MTRTIERRIENTKNQKGENGMKKMVVYEHDCMSAARYHLNKYKHWAKVLSDVDVTKSNGFAFIGEWLQVTSQNQVIEGSLVVEYCGYDGNREFKLYRVTQFGKQEIATASRQTLVDFIRIAAEELNAQKEEIEKVEEQEEEKEEQEEKQEEQTEEVAIIEGEKPSRSTDEEMEGFIKHYINQKGWDKNGEVKLSTKTLVNLNSSQLARVAKRLGYGFSFERIENYIVYTFKKN